MKSRLGATRDPRRGVEKAITMLSSKLLPDIAPEGTFKHPSSFEGSVLGVISGLDSA